MVRLPAVPPVSPKGPGASCAALLSGPAPSPNRNGSGLQDVFPAHPAPGEFPVGVGGPVER